MLSSYLFPTILSVGLFFLIQRLFHYLQRLRMRWRKGCLPAPRLPQSTWRLGSEIRALMMRIKVSGHQTQSMQSLFNRYGQTFQATIWGQPWIWTCDAENIKAVNTSCSSAFGVEPIRKPANHGWMGDGIFVSDGERWRASRALFKPLFAKTGLVDLSPFDREVRRVIDMLPKAGATVNLQDVFRTMFLEVSFGYLFGASPGVLLPDGQATIDIDRFHAAFEAATIGMSRRHALGRALRWADRDEKQWREACVYVHNVFNHYIDTAIQQYETNTEKFSETVENGSMKAEDVNTDNRGSIGTQTPASMLSSLVEVTRDRNFLRDQLLNVFLGAKDTATIGISDVFFHLSRHPEVWRKLRAEIITSNKAATLGPGQPLTFETLKALPYLQNVLRESLRLLSPVDIMSRVCVRDTVLPRGGGSDGSSPLFISEGTRIEGRLASMHRNVQFWGKDADSFIPERWERWSSLEERKEATGLDGNIVATHTDDGKHGSPPRWEYVPFSGGSRMCPARQMTLTQYAVLLVRFAQQFESIENRDPQVEFVEEIKFGKQSKNGVLVELIKAH